jgi:hypothetical protein
MCKNKTNKFIGFYKLIQNNIKHVIFILGEGLNFFGDGPIKVDDCNSASHLILTNSTIN